MNPKANDRVCFIGPTGSGKSYLARAILKHYPNVVVIDTKHRWKWFDLEDSPTPAERAYFDRFVRSWEELYEALHAQDKDHKPIVYRPTREELLTDGHLDRVPRIALARTDTLLYYDELVHIADTNNWRRRALDWYYAVTTGRELGVGIWCSFQRPSYVPVVSMTEADMRFIFYLRRQGDQRVAEEALGAEIPWDALRPEPHSFVYGTDLATSGPTRIRRSVSLGTHDVRPPTIRSASSA